jgi:hypothetical protein
MSVLYKKYSELEIHFHTIMAPLITPEYIKEKNKNKLYLQKKAQPCQIKLL